jgi:hypothetical protein
MVIETLVFSSLNQLTRLVAREYFVMQCRRESYKSYSNCNIVLPQTSRYNKVSFPSGVPTEVSKKILILPCMPHILTKFSLTFDHSTSRR